MENLIFMKCLICKKTETVKFLDDYKLEKVSKKIESKGSELRRSV